MKSLLAAVVFVFAFPGVSLVSAASAVKGAEPLKVSHGARVELADYVVPGKITVFDFYSRYCPPCMAIAPYVEKLHAKRDDLAVVKVDINRAGVEGIDWDSPVVQQYHLESVPHFVIYGPDGKLMAEGDDAYLKIREWVQALPAS